MGDKRGLTLCQAVLVAHPGLKRQTLSPLHGRAL
jgi:hypothetical protein